MLVERLDGLGLLASWVVVFTRVVIEVDSGHVVTTVRSHSGSIQLLIVYTNRSVVYTQAQCLQAL